MIALGFFAEMIFFCSVVCLKLWQAIEEAIEFLNALIGRVQEVKQHAVYCPQHIGQRCYFINGF